MLRVCISVLSLTWLSARRCIFIGKRDDGAKIMEFEASHGTVADMWEVIILIQRNSRRFLEHRFEFLVILLYQTTATTLYLMVAYWRLGFPQAHLRGEETSINPLGMVFILKVSLSLYSTILDFAYSIFPLITK